MDLGAALIWWADVLPKLRQAYFSTERRNTPMKFVVDAGIETVVTADDGRNVAVLAGGRSKALIADC